MSFLTWHVLGLGVIEAWHRDDGTDARCVVRIENWIDAYRLTAKRYHTSPDRPISLQLAYGAFTLDDAKRFAEIIEAEFPATDANAPSPAAVLAHFAAAGRGRCQFVHAWPYGATDEDVCGCGRVTMGFARAAGLKVPA